MNPKTQRNILIVILLLLLGGGGYLYNQYSKVKTNLNISKQNQSALKDSVKAVKNKNDELEYTKNILVSKKKELKQLNKELGKELEKEKGKVRQLNKVVAEIKNESEEGEKDTIKTDNELKKLDSTRYSLRFKVDTSYDESNGLLIKGNSRFNAELVNDSVLEITPLKTSITDFNMRFDMVSGLREKKDGKVEYFVRSSHPGFSVNEIHSSIIDPNKHPVLKKFTKTDKWGIGPQVGVGLSNQLQPSIYIGIGVHYSLITF